MLAFFVVLRLLIRLFFSIVINCSSVWIVRNYGFFLSRKFVFFVIDPSLLTGAADTPVFLRGGSACRSDCPLAAPLFEHRPPDNLPRRRAFVLGRSKCFLGNVGLLGAFQRAY
jgi:hypothetical protein